MVRLLAFFVVLSLALPCLAGEPDIKLDTMRSARVGFPPLTVRVRAAVRPDERNRRICIVWDGPNASGSGCQDVDGLAGPVSFWRDIRFIRGGEYEVSARLSRNDGSVRLSNIIIVRVLEAGQE